LFNNYHSPAIGSYAAQAESRIYNILRFGDDLALNLIKTEGMEKYGALYALPFNSWDTALVFESEGARTEVVSEPFNELDITGRAASFSLALRQPLFRSLAREFALQVKLEHKYSKTYLFDEPFSFSQGAVDGETRTTVLELAQEWVSRGLTHAAVIRSGFNFGLDLLDATMGSEEPDGQFFYWAGEAQWIQSIPWLESQVKLNLNAQWSNDPLLSLEKFTIGGHDTVRGYRENLLTTDNAVIASIEWRVPVGRIKPVFFSRDDQDGNISLALFYDFGRGSDEDGDTSRIYSLGTGIRWAMTQNIFLEVFYAYAMKSVDLPPDNDLQDDGIHFQFKAILF
ncbi:MAG: ShlB/FhaC/HecB family hemolysin secretion/activation protein, partial [Desulfobacteraceae bacterium]|nr:ShlB/FhaC/HecB family hemolysin secretion/activation protein [Desulfobacteraceae bacterium]